MLNIWNLLFILWIKTIIILRIISLFNQQTMAWCCHEIILFSLWVNAHNGIHGFHLPGNRNYREVAFKRQSTADRSWVAVQLVITKATTLLPSLRHGTLSQNSIIVWHKMAPTGHVLHSTCNRARNQHGLCFSCSCSTSGALGPTTRSIRRMHSMGGAWIQQ